MIYISDKTYNKFNYDILSPFENNNDKLILPCPYFDCQFSGTDRIYNSVPAKLNFSSILLFKLDNTDKQRKYAKLLSEVIRREFDKKLDLVDNEDYTADKDNVDYLFKSYNNLYNFLFMSESYFQCESGGI